MIKNINCNLLDAPADCIIQVNNCFNVQGGGLALAIRNKYPEVFDKDSETKIGDKSKLGTCFVTYLENPDNLIKEVIGLYAQFSFGAEKRQLNYEAIYRCLQWVFLYSETNEMSVGIPYGLGCGLAGGKWEIVYAMIVSVFRNGKQNVFICKHNGE